MNATAPLPDDRQTEALVCWFLRRTGEAWTAEDERAFQAWLAGCARNREAYARWEADWALMDQMPQSSAARLRAMVALDRASARPLRRRSLVAPMALAGLAAMAVGGGWLGWQQWQQSQVQPVYTQAFRTQRGQQSEMALPDGSRLRLDAGTRLQVTFSRSRRGVRLDHGQAFFDVAADAARPFDIVAAEARITVVGTRFAVRLTPQVPGREGVEVAVEHGHVRVAGPGAQAAADLTAGQRLVFDAASGQARVQALAPDGAAPWRSSPQLSFGNVPLKTALAEMARYADLGIASVDPAVAELRLSATFDPRDAAGTRRLLAAALPIDLVPQAGGYALRARKK